MLIYSRSDRVAFSKTKRPRQSHAVRNALLTGQLICFLAQWSVEDSFQERIFRFSTLYAHNCLSIASTEAIFLWIGLSRWLCSLAEAFSS